MQLEDFIRLLRNEALTNSNPRTAIIQCCDKALEQIKTDDAQATADYYDHLSYTQGQD